MIKGCSEKNVRQKLHRDTDLRGKFIMRSIVAIKLPSVNEPLVYP